MEPWRLRLGILSPWVLGPCIPVAAGMDFSCFVRVKHFGASQAFCTGPGGVGLAFYGGSFGAAGLPGTPGSRILGAELPLAQEHLYLLSRRLEA